MITPSLEEYRALARGATLVPGMRDVLADLDTPVSAFAKLIRGDARAWRDPPSRGGEAPVEGRRLSAALRHLR
jgi:anthranilate synthase component 1